MISREFAFLKPDAVSRKLVGKIISRIEEAEFKILKLKKGRISKELAALLYPNSEEQLTGMGNKTIKTTHEKGGGEKELKERFGTTEAYKIGEKLNEWNRNYMVSADIIAMVLEGEDAPRRVRELIGSTDPSNAKKGTVRGDLGEDSIYNANIEKRACKNLVHASDEQRADIERELFEKHFF